MAENPLAAALIDVAGTLWAEHPTHWVDLDAIRIKRLCDAVPALDRGQADGLCREMARRAPLFQDEIEDNLTLDIRALIREMAWELRLPIQETEIDAVRAAMAVPMGAVAELHADARELLATVKELSLRCIIASNTISRGSQEYWQDFGELGLAEHVDGIVTSFDVGFRKPHPALFQAAIEMAGCCAGQCVFIGNSERNDVHPAVLMGMRVIRVAIEEPAPLTSAADQVVTSLAEAVRMLKIWVTSTPGKGSGR